MHQVLPAKKLRSTIGSAVLGIKKASPLPEIKDLEVRESLNVADTKLSEIAGNGDRLSQASNLKDLDEGQIIDKINEVRDILDDGKMNNSQDDLSPKTKKIITQVFSSIPLIAYLVYAISTGDFSMSGFIEYVKIFFGF